MRAAAITDDQGRFHFATVWPGAYPDGSEPAHIHLSVLAPAHQVRYVDFWFEGDPLITPAQREKARSNGNIVIVKPGESDDGWTFKYDVKLEGN